MWDFGEGSVERTDTGGGKPGPIPFGDAIVGTVCLLMAVTVVWSLVEILPYLVGEVG